jgi:hypothetical protein
VEGEAGRQKLQQNKGICLAMEDMVVKYSVHGSPFCAKALQPKEKS